MPPEQAMELDRQQDAQQRRYEEQAAVTRLRDHAEFCDDHESCPICGTREIGWLEELGL